MFYKKQHAENGFELEREIMILMLKLKKVWNSELQTIFYENDTLSQKQMVEMQMIFLNWLTKAAKTKIMGLFTWSTNKQKYSNNISTKKGNKH